MEREILFRGKRTDNGEWVYGSLISDEPQYGIIVKTDGCESTDDTPDGYYYVQYEIDMSTVGQYTGLTDKNGRKIFEGDIVEFPDGVTSDYYHEIEITNRGVMAFSTGQFYVTDRNVVDMEDLIWGNDDFDGEVVGNIHDNPEMMKGVNTTDEEM